jgi:hypothetical protein
MTNQRKLELMEQLAKQYEQAKENLWELDKAIYTLYEEVDGEDVRKAQTILYRAGIEY